MRDADITAEIDAIVGGRINPRGPGVAVAVVKADVTLHAKGYGLANLEWYAPIAPDTVFNIGSVTKPFTATAILQLEREGRLRLDDSITTYLPDYPTHGREITIHHMLTHTSGIPNFVTKPGFWERESPHDRSPQELMALWRDLPLDFAPGTEYRYSNSGYCLLGMMIETLSGMDYATFIHERIFAPLGMSGSCYMAHGPIIPHRAMGYARKDANGYERAPYMSPTLQYAAGALGATLDDLIRWDAALRAETLLDVKSQRRMESPVRLASGRTEGYGLGWGLSEYRGHRVAHHAGGVPGFSAFFGRFVEDDLTIIILSNLGGFDAAGLARPIANHVLGLPERRRTTIALGEDALRRVAGAYAGGPDGIEVVTITVGDGRLMASGAVEGAFHPVGEATFAKDGDADVELRFEEPADDGFGRLTVVVPFYWFFGRRMGEG